MWGLIIARGGKKVKYTLLQPSSLIIFAISAFTILPGYVLANTDARLFRFDASESSLISLGNFYGIGFLVYGVCHLLFRVRAPRKNMESQKPVEFHETAQKNSIVWICLALLASVLVTTYFVNQIGFIALQTRDVNDSNAIGNGGIFALFRFIPYSCLCVLSFARVKKLLCPNWLYAVTLLMCLAYGVIFVERLLFVFTVLIAGYFSLTVTKKAVLVKATVLLTLFIALFSLISYYRFLFDKDYNLSSSRRFSGNSVVEQVGINLIFFDNISPVANAYESLSSSEQFWGINSYYVSLLQFVPGSIWPEKEQYLNDERVVKRLGVEVGTPTSVTPSPWGEVLLCFGGGGFLVFSLIFALSMRYLDHVNGRIERKNYAKQFAFSCLVLNLIFNARNPVASFFLFSVLFWLPAHALFHFSYQFRGRKSLT